MDQCTIYKTDAFLAALLALECKQLNPDSTPACILISGYLLKPMRSMLGSMRLLKRYSKGTQLFTTPTKCGNRAAMPGAHWPVYVYTDVPVDVMDQTVEKTPLHTLHNCTLHTTDAVPGEQPLSTDKHLTMLFEGGTTKQGLSFIILMNTGASTNFISPQLLRRLQLECQPADAKLRLADDTEAPILGKVQLRLKIQQFSTVVWCYGTDLSLMLSWAILL